MTKRPYLQNPRPAACRSRKNTAVAVRHIPAFTLVELLITITIFSLVVISGGRSFIQITAFAKTVQAKTHLYTEVQAVLDRLASDIQQNGVDYETYYLREVKGETLYNTENYGLYGQAFYTPGDSDDPSPLTGPYDGITGYGTLCSDGSSYYPDDCPDETPNYDYLDLNMGTHPFTGIGDFSSMYDEDTSSMNAFCQSDGSIDCTELSYGFTDDLILINSRGDERMAYALIPSDSSGSEYQLGKVELTGSDADSDGVIDEWECSSLYSCSETEDGLTAITAKTINIESFTILISPPEDPYRGFDEEDIQIQPQVTVIITASLSTDYGSNFLGAAPKMSVEKTFSTGVYHEITSYE